MCKTPHIHAELIKAWADGATIQCLQPLSGSWRDLGSPLWATSCNYRIKPEPKPDKAYYGVAVVCELGHAYVKHLGPCNTNEHNNIKLIFDGETHKLKKVELLNE